MNYWKQFAEMLGLELDEEFSLTKFDGEKVNEDTYKITGDGLLYKAKIGINWYSEPLKTIYYLLRGEYKAVPNPWKPKVCGNYWRYSIGLGRAYKDTWFGSLHDLAYWKIGNCFKTEEANTKGKEIIEQIEKEFEEA